MSAAPLAPAWPQSVSQPLTFVPFRAVNARKKALEAEKERSARVASLPLPPPNPIQVIFKPHLEEITCTRTCTEQWVGTY